MVYITTEVLGRLLRRREAASMPFMWGMERSKMMRSGRREFAFSTASTPLTASPQTSNLEWCSKKVRTAFLTEVSSSTMRMRLGIRQGQNSTGQCEVEYSECCIWVNELGNIYSCLIGRSAGQPAQICGKRGAAFCVKGSNCRGCFGKGTAGRLSGFASSPLQQNRSLLGTVRNRACTSML